MKMKQDTQNAINEAQHKYKEILKQARFKQERLRENILMKVDGAQIGDVIGSLVDFIYYKENLLSPLIGQKNMHCKWQVSHTLKDT